MKRKLNIYLIFLMIIIGFIVNPQVLKAEEACHCEGTYQTSCNESQNPLGANRCNTVCDCTYARTCSSGSNKSPGWCSGPAKPDDRCYCLKGNQRTCNESENPLGANRCKSDCDCTYGRTCSDASSQSPGWCSGTEKPDDHCYCIKNAQRTCNEATNPSGPNHCKSDCDCTVGRTCNESGLCTGKANRICCEDCFTDEQSCMTDCMGEESYLQAGCETVCLVADKVCNKNCGGDNCASMKKPRFPKIKLPSSSKSSTKGEQPAS